MINGARVDWLLPWRWWIGELRSLLPAVSLSRKAKPRRAIVVASDGRTAAIYLDRHGGTELLSPRPVATEALAGTLAQFMARQPNLPVGLRLEQGAYFSRDVAVPVGVGRDLKRVLALDLERTTPFKAQTVYTAHDSGGARRRGGLLHVQQLIAKRQHVDELRGALRLAGREPAFVDVWNTQRTGGAGIDFLDGDREEAAGSARSIAIMAVLAGVLALVAVTIPILRKQDALSRLEAEGARLEQVAQAARQGIDNRLKLEAQQLALSDAVHARARATVILDEVSRLLPDTIWLRTFRLDGDVIELSGSAPSAARLIELLERSGHFGDGQFVAPIRLEEDSGREQFRLRAKLRTSASAEARNGSGEVAR